MFNTISSSSLLSDFLSLYPPSFVLLFNFHISPNYPVPHLLLLSHSLLQIHYVLSQVFSCSTSLFSLRSVLLLFLTESEQLFSFLVQRFILWIIHVSRVPFRLLLHSILIFHSPAIINYFQSCFIIFSVSSISTPVTFILLRATQQRYIRFLFSSFPFVYFHLHTPLLAPLSLFMMYYTLQP